MTALYWASQLARSGGARSWRRAVLMPHRRDGSSALGCGAEAGQRGQRSREEVVESALFSLFQLLHVRDDLGARGFKSVLRTFQDV